MDGFQLGTSWKEELEALYPSTVLIRSSFSPAQFRNQEVELPVRGHCILPVRNRVSTTSTSYDNNSKEGKKLHKTVYMLAFSHTHTHTQSSATSTDAHPPPVVNPLPLALGQQARSKGSIAGHPTPGESLLPEGSPSNPSSHWSTS